ncbi:MAG: hypothetical protein V1808_02760 [Candidatus Daviesbacteria bacterium]
MIKFLKDKQILKILILAILIRLLIAPFYFHPDIKTYNFQSSFLSKGVWNIYDYLKDNQESLPLKEEFVYFPLTYFVLGGYQIIAQPFLGSDFKNWLSDASEQATDKIGTFRYLFILKLPYLFLDVALAFLLMSYFNTNEKKKNVLTLWLLNPFSLILIYVYSNVDILAVFLATLSLILAYKQKFILAALFLGIGAGFKVYPLLLLPIVVLMIKGFKQKFLMIGVCISIFFVIILPFLKSTIFFQSALVSGLTTRMFIPSINLGFNETLILPIILFTILFFLGIFEKNKKEKLMVYCFSLLLILFATIHFHIQWLLWLMPVAVVLAVSNKNLLPYIFTLITMVFLIPLLYEDKSMTVSLFSVISATYNNLPTPFSLIQKFYNPYVLQSILHSIFVGASLIFIWKIVKEDTA